jgi:broad specificity phosphatase PhoE
MAITRVWLIRHGQTDWNQDGRWQGQLDIPLNEEGKRQAELLAESLRDRGISAVYTSDLMRARHTAETIARRLNVPLHNDPRWREMNLGVFQGLTLEQIEARYPIDVIEMRTNYLTYQSPQGESRLMMQERAFAALQDAMKASNGAAEARFAVVSHGGTIKILMQKLFPDDPQMNRIHIPNTSTTLIESLDDVTWRLVEVAATTHLQPDSIGRTNVDGA